MQEYLPQASSFASEIDWLFWLITGIVGFWFIVAQTVFFWFVISSRRQPGKKAAYIEGKSKQEKKWITIPHILIILCDVVLVAGAVRVWNQVKLDLPEADSTIRITARQWAWIFQHPGPDNKLDTEDDIITTDELRIQNGLTYHFELTAEDVIHSLSIPAFRLKQDAVPGRNIKGWFKPIITGEFDIQCAEMCGLGHGLMPAKLIVQDQLGHAAWLESVAPTPKDSQQLAAR